ncbi:MAG: methyltransferase domain-containing protein [Myxococcaceae bacterium]|nr:methyltransferase domain-containing protein [Myxococcaceae bacterium]
MSHEEPRKTADAYLFARQDMRQRLDRLADHADPATHRRVQALGLREGWSCFEVGFGSGSIALWLSQQVGPQGRVLAVDLDPRFLDDKAEPNLAVRQQDITRERPPEQAFDLVHARLVLMHLPQREQVLEWLMTSLKPGGWLLVEEHELFPTLIENGVPAIYPRFWKAMRETGHRRGMDSGWARKVPMLMQQHGLQQVGTDVDMPLFNGGSPAAEFWRLTAEALLPQMEAHGLLTRHELAEAITLMRDSSSWLFGPAMVATWGRRPAV